MNIVIAYNYMVVYKFIAFLYSISLTIFNFVKMVGILVPYIYLTSKIFINSKIDS